MSTNYWWRTWSLQIRGSSSTGWASALQAEGCGFKSRLLHEWWVVDNPTIMSSQRGGLTLTYLRVAERLSDCRPLKIKGKSENWGVVQAQPNNLASCSEKRGSIPLRSTKAGYKWRCIFLSELFVAPLSHCKGRVNYEISLFVLWIKNICSGDIKRYFACQAAERKFYAVFESCSPHMKIKNMWTWGSG